MGKKEKLKKVARASQPSSPQKLITMDRLLGIIDQDIEAKVVNARGEIYNEIMELKEAVKTLLIDVTSCRSEFRILVRSIMDKGLISDDDLKNAKDANMKEIAGLFTPEGRMVGRPVVTMYNCGFDQIDLRGNEADLVVVNNFE